MERRQKKDDFPVRFSWKSVLILPLFASQGPTNNHRNATGPLWIDHLFSICCSSCSRLHPRGIVSLCMCIVCDTANLSGDVKLPTIPVSLIIPNPLPDGLLSPHSVYLERAVFHNQAHRRQPVNGFLGLSFVQLIKTMGTKPRENNFFSGSSQSIQFLSVGVSVCFTYLTLSQRLDETKQ